MPEAEVAAFVDHFGGCHANTPPFEWNPAERALAAPPLEPNLPRVFLAAGVLLTDFAQRIGVQSQFMSSTSGEVD